MSDPVAFGTARLDEDEALASGRVCSEWKVIGSRVWLPLGGGSRLVAEFSDQPSSEPSAAEHVARHDPARVLREVDAGRRTLERHRPDRSGCQYCERPPGPGPCPDLADLLDRWSDHPDYDQGWKP
jgi:hypothetical protein